MRKFIKLTAALCAVFLLSLCLFSTVAYAAPEDETADPPAEAVTESVPPAESKPEDDFIIGTLPPGTGTVVDAFTDEDGRKFYTIQTPAGNTFYLIIDFTKQGENVYFLDAVQEKDLLALAEKAANPNGANPNPGANANNNPAPTTPGNQTEPEPKESGGNSMFSMILVVLVDPACDFQVFYDESDHGGDANQDSTGGFNQNITQHLALNAQRQHGTQNVPVGEVVLRTMGKRQCRYG